ncbi:MAG: MFS transporter, partial [Candidatus Dormibacteraeota bacterium]|nr:MFS transporter [Candidatus Dormibacteraeota bacterium]
MIPVLLRRDRVFRRYWMAQTVSLFGDQITTLALPLTAVLLLHSTAAQMGYLTAAVWLPYLLFSLLVGAWVDRSGRRRRAMIIADVGRALLLGTVPLLALLHALSIYQLYAVAFAAGVLSVVFSVSQQSLFQALVHRERLIEGTSLVNGSRAFSLAAGPSLAGLLTQVFSAPVAILGDCVSFVASAVLLGSINPAEPPSSRNEPHGLSGGARFIRHSRVVGPALACTATINLFNFAFSALYVLFAVRQLGVSPGTLGLVLGTGAMGSIVGSLFTSRIARRIGVGPAYIAGCVLFTVPLILVPLAGGASWV